MSGRRRWLGRVLSWALAIAALVFVATSVPVRDQCWDPRAPVSTKLAVSRHDHGGCTLHLRSGDVRIEAPECAQLRCEPGVTSTFAHVRLGVLGALLLLYGLGTLPWAARWRALLGFAGVDVSFGEVLRVCIEAQAGGVLLPGGIGGDALRVVSLVGRSRRSGAPPSTAIFVASVLLDRAVGLAVLSAMAATLGFAWGGMRAGPLAFALAAIPVAFLAGLAVLRAAPLDRARSLLESRAGAAIRPVLEYVRHPQAPRAIAVAASLSVLVAAGQLATIRGLVLALGGVPTAEKWVYVGSAMAFLVGALPALPGAWGTADAAYVFFLGLAGLPASTALGVSLLYRLFWYLLGIAGAALHVARPRASAVAARAGTGAEPPA